VIAECLLVCSLFHIGVQMQMQIWVRGVFWLHYWAERQCHCGEIMHWSERQRPGLLSAFCAASSLHKQPVICSSWHVPTYRTVCVFTVLWL